MATTTVSSNGHVAIEVHDSGPGLSDQARASLFQPTITFKKRGMGLGLSIARKSALLSGGDHQAGRANRVCPARTRP